MHVNKEVVSSVIAAFKEKFSKIVVMRGDKYNLLGMHLKFYWNMIVEINIFKYICDALKDFEEELKSVITPARNNLFNVDIQSKLLLPKKKKRF